MKEHFFVTTPIYYVNDVPHIGHAYTTIAADILARRNRLLGRQVFFLTGTDEHGQKVEKAAAEKKRTPKEHADIMVENFRRLWKTLNVSLDSFIRTTDTEHMKTVQGLMQMLWDRGEIEKRSYSGWYCTPDERFWTEKELVDGNCPDCGRTVEQIHEENYFFLMSKYQKPLIDYIEENPAYILPETRRNEVMGFLKNNTLGDLCISRPVQRLSWGIPLPFDADFVTYVWFDALVNYFSATRYLAPGAEKARTGEFWWPASHHIIGKDILITHAIYWSTMLMALSLPLPGNIFAHGWWTVEGRKMSKSLGNVVDPHVMVDRYGVDAFRYFLFREVPFGLDGDFSEEAFVRRINTDLANDLGNLVSRTLTMIQKYRGGVISASIDSKDEWDWEGQIKDNLSGRNDLEDRYESALKDLRFHNALDHVWDVISLLNRYVDKRALWKEEDEGKRSNTLYVLAEALGIIAVYLFPFMPITAQRIWDQLGIADNIAETRKIPKWGDIRVEGSKIKAGEQLFPRIVLGEIGLKIKLVADTGYMEGKKNMEAVPVTNSTIEENTPVDDYISIEDFAKVELKIGRVITAERVEKSDKLIRLKVDIGEERQIVAGIGKAYDPEYLVGKEIVVVANLKPAKLMGVESRGMLLAASDDDGKPSILILDREVKPGTRVK